MAIANPASPKAGPKPEPFQLQEGQPEKPPVNASVEPTQAPPAGLPSVPPGTPPAVAARVDDAIELNEEIVDHEQQKAHELALASGVNGPDDPTGEFIPEVAVEDSAA